jgi:Holliday junction resolvase RusA-like endonuclease
MTELVINVVGTPVAQGSKVANRHGGGVRDSNAKKLKPWRAEVAGIVADTISSTGWQTLDEPCEVEITFFHARPQAHYGTGRNAGILKPTAPHWKATAPDVDKLTRAILDSLTTAQAFRDDGRVARLLVEDRYADAATGARITVRPLRPSPADASSPVRAAGEASQEVLFQ